MLCLDCIFFFLFYFFFISTPNYLSLCVWFWFQINSHLNIKEGECMRDREILYQPNKEAELSSPMMLSFENNRILFGKGLDSHKEYDASIFHCGDEGAVGRGGRAGKGCGITKVRSTGVINMTSEEQQLRLERPAQEGRDLVTEHPLNGPVVFGNPSSLDSDECVSVYIPLWLPCPR